MNSLDTKAYKEKCRDMIYNGHEFLITEVGTSEANKSHLGVNCGGFGRIRVFKRYKDSDWIENPLPFEPYSAAMGESVADELAVQVFQVAKCNLNCWWCFLPDEYKVCDLHHSRWFSADDLLNLYLREGNEVAKVIDISGGNPELVPELTLQIMQGIEKNNLSDKIYLWSDDVLTTDYLFTKLPETQVHYMAQYKGYGKVACFKGIDDESFCYNTCSRKSEFGTQLSIAKKYVNSGFDIYFYVVLTLPNLLGIERKISLFMDQLQDVSYYLPLRVVPIKIKVFPNNENRLNPSRILSISNQFRVLSIWREEIAKRYHSIEIDRKINMQPIA